MEVIFSEEIDAGVLVERWGGNEAFCWSRKVLKEQPGGDSPVMGSLRVYHFEKV